MVFKQLTVGTYFIMIYDGKVPPSAPLFKKVGARKAVGAREDGDTYSILEEQGVIEILGIK